MSTSEQGGNGAPITAWSREWGLRLPVVNAPMGGVAGGRLAAAVTAAGGLGMIGMGSAGSAAALRRELRYVAAGSGPFGIGMVEVMAREPELLEVAIAASPTLVAVGFGSDFAWVARVHDAGIRAVTQIYSADEARRAEGAGIDLVVARGTEGGGHGVAGLSTLPLLEAVLDAVSIPVLAAGGIGAPSGLAAVLAAGASGAWLGTCLAACAESLLPDSARAAMIAADGTETVLTTAFDVAMGLPWPTRFPSRVLRNDFTARWVGNEEGLRDDPTARQELAAAAAANDFRTAPIDAGQGVGRLTAVSPAGEVVTELCRGAAELLARRR
ncbi:NAD(P)H-dependent flavin oxidoreductase [Nocardia arizonensis]|uniref:NAD(P)H-dependent flavin oxidoreductase n=1 Tax=Nocardia arizonensis TaxID=1141647 RepID=UPI0006CF3EE9|nr:nitronate monooxygenase [Nocardia arizonensis]